MMTIVGLERSLPSKHEGGLKMYISKVQHEHVIGGMLFWNPGDFLSWK